MRSLLYIVFLLASLIGKSQVQLITNGDFLLGSAPWVFNSQYWNLATTSNSGCIGALTQYAYHGNANGSSANNSFGGAYQQISIPSNAISATLNVDISINTQETGNTINDVFDVQLRSTSNNALLHTFASFSNLNGIIGTCRPYTNYTFQIPASFFGQTVRLYFQAANGPALPTVFGIDNVSVLATIPASCITWSGGTPGSDPELLMASEYLCNRGIIENIQNTGQLYISQDIKEVCLWGSKSLQQISNTSIADNFPIIFSGYENLPLEYEHAFRNMLYLEFQDGRSPLQRDYYSLQPFMTASIEKGLRVLLETWDIQPDWTGYNAQSGSPSSFACNIKQNDPYYGYVKKAFDLGFINRIINTNCSNCGTPPCINLAPKKADWWVILYNIMQYRAGNVSVSNADFYNPLNISKTNVSTPSDFERGVFNTYEQSGFSFSGGGLPLDFDITYQSDIVEIPKTFFEYSITAKPLEKLMVQRINPLGYGWTHSYNIFIQSIPDDNVNGPEHYLLIKWGNGSSDMYDLFQNKYVSKGVYDQLTVTANDPFGNPSQLSIKTKDQIIYKFIRDINQRVFLLSEISDRNNNIISLIYENGASVVIDGNTVQGPFRLNSVAQYNNGIPVPRTINFSYKPNTNLLSKVTDILGRELKFYVNEFTSNLDSFNNARSYTTQYKYCGNDTCANLLIEIQRPKNNWIKNTYAKRKLKQTQTPKYTASVNFSTNYNPGNQTTQSVIQTTPDIGYGYSTTYQHNALGLPTAITSAASATTIQYSDAANPTLPTNILDNLTGITNTNTYDIKGNNTISIITGGALSQTTTSTYNSNNDVTQIQLPNGSVFNNTYDVKGNLTNEIGPLGLNNQYTRNANGSVNTTTNANNIISAVEYNGFGNPKKISINGTSIQSEAFYDNASRITHVKDARNTISKYLYDNNDNIIQIVTDTAALKLTTNYRFDANDNNDLVIAPKGDSTKLTYDLNDDLVQEDYGPFNRKWFYYQDGSLSGIHKKNGVNLNNIYYPSGSLFEGKLQQNFLNLYDYDSTTRILKKVTSYNGFSNTITYSYDALLRPTSVQFNNSTPAVSNELQYGYDISNFQTKIIIPELNKFYRYVPDALNRISEVYDWNNVLLIKYIYRPDGQMDSEQLGNGANVFYHYDNAGRLDSIYAKKSDNTLLYSVGASLDNTGNHIRESLFIKKDSLPFTIPQSDSITAYQYEFSTNRLISANGQTVVSDNNGNIIKNQYSGFNSGAVNATYDNLNNITSCNVDGKQYSLRYNAYNNRFIVDTFRRIVDVLNNGNVIVNNGNVIVNKGISGTVQVLYCHSPNGLVCSIDPVTNAKKWYLYDFRGSTIAVLNENQNIEQYYKYDPFGAIEESSHIPGTKTPFLYVGKYGVEYHSPHLYYMRARYYDPNNGRFYGEDPVWGTNLFAYAANNPVGNIDPNGDCPPCLVAAIYAIEYVPIALEAYGTFSIYRDLIKGDYESAGLNASLANGLGTNVSYKPNSSYGGGRLGSINTRTFNYNIGTQIEREGGIILGGGGRLPEEYLKPLGGGRRGGSFIDITASNKGELIRINTVDTYKSGRITSRELKNAARIEKQIGKPIKLIPKR
jgi:RHS repeat-associated protein